MRINFQCSIDIDENRKIWMEGSAEGVDPEQIPDVSKALGDAVTEQALDTYNEYAERNGIGAPGARGPAMPPTFQEDDKPSDFHGDAARP